MTVLREVLDGKVVEERVVRGAIQDLEAVRSAVIRLEGRKS